MIEIYLIRHKVLLKLLILMLHVIVLFLKLQHHRLLNHQANKLDLLKHRDAVVFFVALSLPLPKSVMPTDKLMLLAHPL